MTGATVGGVASSYTYDADGTRVAKNVGGAVTSFVWDRESGLPLMIDDGASEFVYGEGQVSSANAGGTNFVLADALSSARLQTDGSGAVSGTASFDAFGAVRTSTGVNTSFRFTGEYSDAETGWTFLRARYLDPLLGRFPSVDPVTPGGPGTGG